MNLLDFTAQEVARAKKATFTRRNHCIDAPMDLGKRNFRADAPNKLWLTGITKLAPPGRKRYLSPIVDFFDGKVIQWPIGTRPRDCRRANGRAT